MYTIYHNFAQEDCMIYKFHFDMIINSYLLMQMNFDIKLLSNKNKCTHKLKFIFTLFHQLLMYFFFGYSPFWSLKANTFLYDYLEFELHLLLSN